MVKPALYRRAVDYAQTKYEVSQRHACRALGFGRSSCQYRSKRVDPAALVTQLHELAAERPRFGYKRLCLMLRRKGHTVNHKRVYRLYKAAGLAVRRRNRKRIAATLKRPHVLPTAPNQRWSMDFVSDAFDGGRTFRVLNVVDDFSRECLAAEVDTSLPGLRVARVLDRISEQRGGYPKTLVVDNGPEFTGRELDAWAHRHKVDILFIRPGKPIENAFVESFNGRMRDECLNQHWFISLNDARTRIEEWRIDYNTERPHSALGNLPPARYADEWRKKQRSRFTQQVA
jgi:putative transposase